MTKDREAYSKMEKTGKSKEAYEGDVKAKKIKG